MTYEHSLFSCYVNAPEAHDACCKIAIALIDSREEALGD